MVNNLLTADSFRQELSTICWSFRRRLLIVILDNMGFVIEGAYTSHSFTRKYIMYKTCIKLMDVLTCGLLLILWYSCVFHVLSCAIWSQSVLKQHYIRYAIPMVLYRLTSCLLVFMVVQKKINLVIPNIRTLQIYKSRQTCTKHHVKTFQREGQMMRFIEMCSK